jgi:hypothetical protein
MEVNTIRIDEIMNLLLNMSGGLLPEHLNEDEVRLLEAEYGVEWFDELGYTEPEYKKPTFK